MPKPVLAPDDYTSPRGRPHKFVGTQYLSVDCALNKTEQFVNLGLQTALKDAEFVTSALRHTMLSCSLGACFSPPQDFAGVRAFALKAEQLLAQVAALEGNGFAQLRVLSEGISALPALPGVPVRIVGSGGRFPGGLANYSGVLPGHARQAVQAALAALCHPGVEEKVSSLNHRLGHGGPAGICFELVNAAIRLERQLEDFSAAYRRQVAGRSMGLQQYNLQHAAAVALQAQLAQQQEQAAARAGTLLAPATLAALRAAAAYAALAPTLAAALSAALDSRTLAAAADVLAALSASPLDIGSSSDGEEDGEDGPDAGSPAIIINPNGGRNGSPAVSGSSGSGQQRKYAARAISSHPLADCDDDQVDDDTEVEGEVGELGGEEDGEAGAAVAAPRGGPSGSDDEGAEASVEEGGRGWGVAHADAAAATTSRRRGSLLVCAARFVRGAFGRKRRS